MASTSSPSVSSSASTSPRIFYPPKCPYKMVLAGREINQQPRDPEETQKWSTFLMENSFNLAEVFKKVRHLDKQKKDTPICTEVYLPPIDPSKGPGVTLKITEDRELAKFMCQQPKNSAGSIFCEGAGDLAEIVRTFQDVISPEVAKDDIFIIASEEAWTPVRQIVNQHMKTVFQTEKSQLELERLIELTVDHFKLSDVANSADLFTRINELCRVYTTLAAAHAILDFPLTIEQAALLSIASPFLTSVGVKRTIGMPLSDEEILLYEKYVQLMRETIEAIYLENKEKEGTLAHSLESLKSERVTKCSLMLMLGGGMENSPPTLAFMLYALGRDKARQSLCRLEINKQIARNKEGNNLYKLAKKNRALNQFIKMSLSFFTPSIMIPRTLAHAVEILDEDLKVLATLNQGDRLLFSPVLASKDPKHYDNPEGMDDERINKPSPLTFGAMKRICPAATFVPNEILPFLHFFLARFEWKSFPESVTFGGQTVLSIQEPLSFKISNPSSIAD